MLDVLIQPPYTYKLLEMLFLPSLIYLVGNFVCCLEKYIPMRDPANTMYQIATLKYIF